MIRRMSRLAVLLLALAGCGGDVPALDPGFAGGAARGTAYPDLVPAEGLLAAAAGRRLDPREARGMAARAATLRQKARALGGPVIDDATRRRLQDALARHRGA